MCNYIGPSDRQIWKKAAPMKGVDLPFEISTWGQVRCIKTKRNITFSYNARRGYNYVSYAGNAFDVHLMMTFTFLHNYHGSGLDTDHKDNDKLNNKLSNLRLVTRRTNSHNRFDKNLCTSKQPGVYWESGRKKWSATILINGVRKRLGRFKTEEEAVAAYQAKLNEILN